MRLRARLAPLSGPVGRTRNDRGRGFYNLTNDPRGQLGARPDPEETPRRGRWSPAHVTRYPGGVAASGRQANEHSHRAHQPGTSGPRACVTGAGLRADARARASAARHVGRPPAIRRGGGPSRPSDGCRSVLVLSFQYLRRRAAPRRTLPCARSAHRLDLLVRSRSSSPVVSGAQREQAFFPRAGFRPRAVPPTRAREPFWWLRRAGTEEVCSGARRGRARAGGCGESPPRAIRSSRRGRWARAIVVSCPLRMSPRPRASLPWPFAPRR